MHPFLDRILAHKRSEVEGLKAGGAPEDIHVAIPGVRNFKKAVSRQGGVNLIAEIKFASPSTGCILNDRDPVSIARMYEAAGAGAVSVLTDRRFFHGDIHYIPRIRGAISLPILRKDFIIDPVQVEESARYGADAILLIAGILTPDRLKELLTLARTLGMACLTEVHNKQELEIAMDSGADIIGINNRDLRTFKVDLRATMDLAPLIPEACVRVSESGVSRKEDIAALRQSGIHAVLVGSSIMWSRDIKGKARELAVAGRDHDTG